LNKYDILSQRGLAKIKETLEIIKYNRPDAPEIDIDDVKKFKLDPKINNLIKEAQCIGCFYVESPAMRMLLKKLQVDNYLGLVAASSIIRPGVAKSGMMREYIVRFRNQHLRDQARAQLPELYELLEETYGVMVYQEDVIKVAHYFADLSLAEADYLRRGMSWKFKQRNEFFRVREKFFTNCLKKGHAEKRITEIWNQIESFANFAFSSPSVTPICTIGP
jgi:DNA polymerase-3 subunit alpha